ncbi:hypothetical protein K438DRAFT_1941717 [Mycena galopus ATCC 62051]|nr:hypothetical protein K438DRAFT_1941717 [Mycena galopus ATCC 62051]
MYSVGKKSRAYIPCAPPYENHPELGISVGDRFTHYILEYMWKIYKISHDSMADLQFSSCDPAKIHSDPGVRSDLFPRLTRCESRTFSAEWRRSRSGMERGLPAFLTLTLRVQVRPRPCIYIYVRLMTLSH